MYDVPVLRFDADQPLHPFLACAKPLIENVCGIAFAPDDTRAPALYYGDDAGRSCLLRLPRVDGYSESTLPGLADVDETPRPGAPFPFDPISAVRFWLADEGNTDAPADAWDAHRRLLPEKSVQSRLEGPSIPMVNAYLLALRRWLENRLGRTLRNRLLPPDKRAAVVLTHDVDNPFDPGDSAHFLSLARMGMANRRPGPALRQVFNAARAAARRVRAPRDRHWLFDDIVAAESRHGFNSTFFFAATSPVTTGGHPYDVLYDLDQPPLRRVLDRLSAADAEIGLHTSYRAHEQVGRFAEERHRLERAIGRKVLGNRHHYWHMGRPFWDTLVHHAEAGFRYDASIGFNGLPGYRLGAALPFKPWHPGTGAVIDCWQIPCMTMDGALCDRAGASPESALADFGRLLAVLKRFEGTAAIDWHVRTSIPASRQYTTWGTTYLGILDTLAADPEVAVFRACDIVP